MADDGGVPGVVREDSSGATDNTVDQWAQAKTDVRVLQETARSLAEQSLIVTARIDGYRVKCPTCRCRILPWEECACCADTSCYEDRP